MKNHALYCSFLITLFLVSSIGLFAQNENIDRKQRMALHNEMPDNAYLPPSADNGQLTSPAYSKSSSVFFTTQVNINDTGENIMGDAANEPSIAIDPTNPDRMAIGWRQFDNISSNFRQAGTAFTSDRGLTWTFPGVIDPGVFRSDPVLETDNEGVFYYNSLTANNNNYFCRVFRSTDGGEMWDEGVSAQGGDKQWMEIDKTGGEGDGNIYSFWTSYYSICYPGNFTRSTDGGAFYENCVSVDGDPYWGTLAIGPSGELYLAGSGFNDGLVVVRSNNAQNAGETVSWDYYTQVDLDGAMLAGPDVNPAGLLGQASIAVDMSEGPANGFVYVLASVDRPSNWDPGDVMFARSEDGGFSFSEPVRINNDLSLSNTQWFGTMSVAPNGRIDVVWLDTRDAPQFNDLYSSLYYSYSLDHGETWSDNERLSESFDPHLGWPNQEKMGDYFDMISDNTSAHLAWANTLNGEQDVYYGRITPEIISVSEPGKQNPVLAFNASPNPFSDKTRISYMLNGQGKAEISVFNMFGQEVSKITEQITDGGSYSFDLDGNRLPDGIYLCRLTIGNFSKTIRLVKVN